MVKIDAKRVIEAVKARSKDNKVNTTFRLEKSLIKHFKEFCDDAGIKMGPTIEELIRAFINVK